MSSLFSGAKQREDDCDGIAILKMYYYVECKNIIYAKCDMS